MTVPDIATELGVAKSSVSLLGARRPDAADGAAPHPQPHRAPGQGPGPRAEVAAMDALGRRAPRHAVASRPSWPPARPCTPVRGRSDHGAVRLRQHEPGDRCAFFVRWLRTFFDDRRGSAARLGSTSTTSSTSTAATGVLVRRSCDIPVSQFTKPQIVERTATVRSSKHATGCVYVMYSCTRDASRGDGAGAGAAIVGGPSGVAQLAERRTVNPFVVGSSPTPGAPPRVRGASAAGIRATLSGR